ncbi:MAG: hypothetical protein GPJ54_00795 [Candidatus Heimdallarchaeota archaeon]|nr:hypothetical protein [Candidatus Heimdallarchaeota archaeon]
MDFDRDGREKLDKKLVSLYKSIFNELTSIFDRFNVSELQDFPEKFADIDTNIKIVSKIISSYWNLSLDVIIPDFEAEIKRKIENQMEIPDVPTYQIRFALEEGSWIVLLRIEFPKILRSQLSRLVTLEDTIFKTGKAIDDDCAYYLIELDLISQNWIKPLTQYWKTDHDFSKIIDIGSRLISSIFNTQEERGGEIFAGSIRLMQSKMSILERVLQIESTSNWALKARSIYDSLTEQIEKGKYENDILNMFFTISALQKEIIRLDSKKSDEKEDLDSLQYSIMSKIGWENLEIDDDDSLEFFSDALLMVLYDLPFDDPILAAEKLLDQFFSEIKMSKKLERGYRKLLSSELENQTSQLIELEVRDRVIVEVIEEFLPSLFVQMKQGLVVDSLDSGISKLDQILKSDQWENYEAQLSRIKRISDQKIAVETFKKVLRSNYNVLIGETLTPHKAVELLSLNFISVLKIENFQQDTFLEKARAIIDKSKDDGISLVIVDQSLIDLMFDTLNQFII